MEFVRFCVGTPQRLLTTIGILGAIIIFAIPGLLSSILSRIAEEVMYATNQVLPYIIILAVLFLGFKIILGAGRKKG